MNVCTKMSNYSFKTRFQREAVLADLLSGNGFGAEEPIQQKLDNHFLNLDSGTVMRQSHSQKQHSGQMIRTSVLSEFNLIKSVTSCKRVYTKVSVTVYGLCGSGERCGGG